MLDINYAYKSEKIDPVTGYSVYTYQDCFTDNHVTIYGEDNIFTDLEFEMKQHIICDGDSTCSNLTKHIVKLMRPRIDDMEYTDLNVYLTVDGVVACNVDLSTRYLTITDIDNFIRTLIISTENTGICDLSLEFSRSYMDCNTFTIRKSY